MEATGSRRPPMHQRVSSTPSTTPSFLKEDPFAQDPFTSGVNLPGGSRIASIVEEYSEKPTLKPPRRFKSSRLTGEYEKPWLKDRDPRERYDKVFFWGLVLVGFIIGGYICYDGWQSVGNQKYCIIFEDDFQNGINTDDWNYEVQLGNTGTGNFDWTTSDERNAYTDSEGLHIVPTFTTDDLGITNAQLMNGYTVNLTTDGTCTSTNVSNCAVTSNLTASTMINPVRSARLNTRGKHTMTYGKLEVVAKLPAGDWLWPAIWMMPEDSVYGDWPASGEIDIMESRGNDGVTFKDGRNVVGGTLHWGPNSGLDQFARTSNGLWVRRTDFSKDFHVYGLIWTDKYIFTYVDNVLRQSLYVPFGSYYGSMYSRGYFSYMDIDQQGPPANPWASSQDYNAPFDQSFYLILNVAVGATNGYFTDGYGGKPWTDKANNSNAEFWNAKGAWGPTWAAGAGHGMTVKSVKMYNICG